MKIYHSLTGNAITHALISVSSKFTERRHDYFNSDHPIQLSSISLSSGEFVAPHVHQDATHDQSIEQIPFEAWIVVEGSCQVVLYSDAIELDTVHLTCGDMLLTYPGGGHSLKVTSSTCRFVELKNSNYLPTLTKPLS